MVRRGIGNLDNVSVIPGRPKGEPGISRFRVWSFGPSRNDVVGKVARAALGDGEPRALKEELGASSFHPASARQR